MVAGIPPDNEMILVEPPFFVFIIFPFFSIEAPLSGRY